MSEEKKDILKIQNECIVCGKYNDEPVVGATPEAKELFSKAFNGADWDKVTKANGENICIDCKKKPKEKVMYGLRKHFRRVIGDMFPFLSNRQIERMIQGMPSGLDADDMK